MMPIGDLRLLFNRQWWKFTIRNYHCRLRYARVQRLPHVPLHLYLIENGSEQPAMSKLEHDILVGLGYAEARAGWTYDPPALPARKADVVETKPSRKRVSFEEETASTVAKLTRENKRRKQMSFRFSDIDKWENAIWPKSMLDDYLRVRGRYERITPADYYGSLTPTQLKYYANMLEIEPTSTVSNYLASKQRVLSKERFIAHRDRNKYRIVNAKPVSNGDQLWIKQEFNHG